VLSDFLNLKLKVEGLIDLPDVLDEALPSSCGDRPSPFPTAFRFDLKTGDSDIPAAFSIRIRCTSNIRSAPVSRSTRFLRNRKTSGSVSAARARGNSSTFLEG
jgi:hypothetical protein